MFYSVGSQCSTQLVVAWVVMGKGSSKELNIFQKGSPINIEHMLQ